MKVPPKQFTALQKANKKEPTNTVQIVDCYITRHWNCSINSAMINNYDTITIHWFFPSQYNLKDIKYQTPKLTAVEAHIQLASILVIELKLSKPVYICAALLWSNTQNVLLYDRRINNYRSMRQTLLLDLFSNLNLLFSKTSNKTPTYNIL